MGISLKFVIFSQKSLSPDQKISGYRKRFFANIRYIVAAKVRISKPLIGAMEVGLW
jgi:hypothetical protein